MSTSITVTEIFLDGNLITDGAWTNVFNGENRMIRVQPMSPSSGSERVDLAYDYMGRLYREEVFVYTNSAWTAIQTNLWAYDGWNPICQETATSTGADTNWWVHGLDLSGTLQGAGGIGGFLSWTRSSDTNTFLYAADANGNITELLAAADPTNIVASYQWDAYGDVLAIGGNESTNNVFCWSSKYVISQTGDKYYGYRFLRDHRWCSRDPIGEDGGAGLYGFAENTAISAFDILGRETLSEDDLEYERALAFVRSLPPNEWASLANIRMYYQKYRIHFGFFSRTPAIATAEIIGEGDLPESGATIRLDGRCDGVGIWVVVTPSDRYPAVLRDLPDEGTSEYYYHPLVSSQDGVSFLSRGSWNFVPHATFSRAEHGLTPEHVDTYLWETGRRDWSGAGARMISPFSHILTGDSRSSYVEYFDIYPGERNFRTRYVHKVGHDDLRTVRGDSTTVKLWIDMLQTPDRFDDSTWSIQNIKNASVRVESAE